MNKDPIVGRGYLQSDLGLIEITCSELGIQTLGFIETENAYDALDHPIVNECVEQLKAYFGKRLQSFSFPLDLLGTPFQRQVWQLLTTIPYGKSTSYIELAQELGDVKSVRAVGTANGRNPIAIAIPCHRVIGKDGSLVGYAGGLWRKKWLLQHEGHPSFSPNQLLLFDE